MAEHPLSDTECADRSFRVLTPGPMDNLRGPLLATLPTGLLVAGIDRVIEAQPAVDWLPRTSSQSTVLAQSA